ncbi:MAG: peroxiredoxin [Proteobacteria bacterium]|nr:peroxiredoxin [Pseudomonadota bacterium]
MKLNSPAPDFKLKDKDSKSVSLKSIKSKFVVIYFYPKDDTPGCTTEAKEFSDLLKNFKKLDAEIIGISGGDDKTKEKFCKKHKLKITLLSDSDFKVAKAYKSYGPKTFMGKKFTGILRNTFILDEKKKIIKTYEEVKALGHATEVLTEIKNLCLPKKEAPKEEKLKKDKAKPAAEKKVTSKKVTEKKPAKKSKKELVSYERKNSTKKKASGTKKESLLANNKFLAVLKAKLKKKLEKKKAKRGY